MPKDWPQQNNFKNPDIGTDAKILSAGHTFTITGENTSYKIEKVEMASDVAKQFGLKINRVVPIYWVKGMSPGRQGGYHPKTDSVFMFENNTDETTLEHELVHAIEFHTPATPELISLWEKAKEVISESSFSGNFVTFNFVRNVHEFIAEGKTRPAFIDALKKENLYDEFLEQTDYIFK
ncbi:hypothetical protein KAZ66_01055 [Candidatus Woesebacteria bacterium]|jgi:hypothetical protein|nr:hypothetical protein [Candidatus Woesebacteria bacterium]